uniref:Uncharacterized protein n=1 Tax=Tanacetum cinerariifolium TaxID=118510 RepID=A0A699UA36_TANCI|nr:hypothetical protein [Tanacetum cinerariifolium]
MATMPHPALGEAGRAAALLTATACAGYAAPGGASRRARACMRCQAWVASASSGGAAGAAEVGACRANQASNSASSGGVAVPARFLASRGQGRESRLSSDDIKRIIE